MTEEKVIKMFKKKSYIFSETQGVCLVEDIVKLSAQKGGESVEYYLLRSLTDSKKTAYIPVEHHQVFLRELLTEEEARKKQESGVELTEQEQGELTYLLGNIPY